MMIFCNAEHRFVFGYGSSALGVRKACDLNDRRSRNLQVECELAVHGQLLHESPTKIAWFGEGLRLKPDVPERHFQSSGEMMWAYSPDANAAKALGRLKRRYMASAMMFTG